MQGNKNRSRSTLRSIQAEMLNGSVLSRLGKAKLHLPTSDFSPLFNWLFTATRKGKVVGAKLKDMLLPKNIANLQAGPILPLASLDRELRWFYALFFANYRRVNRYLDLAQCFERAFLHEASVECFSILDDIEAEFGQSIWLLETRIASLQYFEGVESQKRYVAELKANGEGNIPWLAVTISKRNEEPTTFFRYYSQTAETIDAVDNLECQAYLKFHALGILEQSPAELVGLLQYNTNGSLIDAYICYVSVLQCCVVDNSHLGYATARECIGRLVKKIPDVRLMRLGFILGDSPHPYQCSHPRISLDGMPRSLSDLYGGSETEWPVAWSEQATQWMLVDDRREALKGVQRKVTASLYNIYSTGAEAEQDISETIKLCLNFKSLNFSNVLSSIVAHELSCSPAIKKSSAITRLVHSNYLDVELLGSFQDDVRGRYAEILRLEFGDEPAVAAQMWGLGIDDELGISGVLSTQLLLLKLKNYYFVQNYRAVVGEGTEALRLLELRERRLASRLVASSLMHLNDYHNLVDFVASVVADDVGNRHFMPIQACVDFLSKDVCQILAKHLSVPIILSLYSRYYDDSLDKKLSYAYEDFLIAYGVDRPSQLADVSDNLDQAQLIYYLRYVCIPRIMKISSEYTGSIEVQNERLAVCSLLLNLDENNSKVYESEIREITRTQAIRRGVRHVEQSKMSIDLIALKKLADKKVKEGFLRYRAMIKAGITPSDELGKAYLRFLAEGEPLPSDLLKVPTDEAGTLLREIVRLILADATINPMHGLDCYLSMRIRHGALSGQLRGPLELENIITKRKGSDDSYASNEIWMGQLNLLSQTVKDQIDLSLCIFSARYDHLINHITDDLIQIKSKEKPDGLFDIFFSVIDLRLLADSIKPDTEFEVFFDSSINTFWRNVELSLQRVQNVIEQSLKSQINDIFETLQTSIAQASPAHPPADLGRAIRTAHTNSIQALEQVKDWFKLPTPRAEPFFEVEELIDVGLQCVQRIHKDFKPILTKEIAVMPPIADALTMFSDIFFILFDNARKYSNANSTPISISMDRKGSNSLVVSVINEFYPRGDEIDEARVEAIRFAISNGDYRSAVSLEGGTGLIKLKKIIGDSQILDFGYTEENTFKVTFSLPLRVISL